MSSIGAQAGSAADHVVTEIDEPQPMTAYDRAKLAAEEEIRLSGVPFTILRPVIVYGPGAKANIALMVRIATLPLPLPFGAFRNRRSLLSIDNLIQAIVLCLDDPATLNQTFIVCDREPITLAEMFAMLRRGGRAIAAPCFNSAGCRQDGVGGRRAPAALGPDWPGTRGELGEIAEGRLVSES